MGCPRGYHAMPARIFAITLIGARCVARRAAGRWCSLCIYHGSARRRNAVTESTARSDFRGLSPPVITCSALTGEGIAALWSYILDHRQRLATSGELKARRGEQQVKWMWTMLEERLFEPLRSDRTLKSALPRIEADVAAGRLAPSAAVEKIAAMLSA